MRLRSGGRSGERSCEERVVSLHEEIINLKVSQDLVWFRKFKKFKLVDSLFL